MQDKNRHESFARNLSYKENGIDNDEVIILKYPLLFGTPPFNDSITRMGDGLACSEKWYPILDDLFKNIEKFIIEKNITDFKILQVKSKFGTLRVYTSRRIDEISILISEAEDAIIALKD